MPKFPNPGSFKSRLAFLNSAIISLALTATIGVLFYAFQKTIQEEIKNSLLSEAKLVARIIDEDNDEMEVSRHTLKPMEEPDLEADIQGIDKIVFVRRLDSGRWFHTLKSEGFDKEAVHKAFSRRLHKVSSYKDLTNPEKKRYRFIHYRYEDPMGRRYIIWVGTSLKKVVWANKRFLLTLAASIPIIFIVSSLAVLLICQRGLRPLDRIIDQAEKIKRGKIQLIPISEKSPKEIRRLTKALNKMLERLRVAFEREKEFSAAASHELKTPLTVLKGEIEVALAKTRRPEEYEELLTANLDQVNHLIDIIDNLLFLARLDGEEFDPSDFEEVDLDQLLRESLEYAGPFAEKEGTRLEIVSNGAPHHTVRGRPQLIRQAIHNLIQNALQHAEAGRIQLKAYRDDGSVKVDVTDDGKGIGEKELPLLFDRFYRTEKSRTSSGNGLGLSIVRAIAAAHGGSVEAESGAGRGSRFTLTFPA